MDNPSHGKAEFYRSQIIRLRDYERAYNYLYYITDCTDYRMISMRFAATAQLIEDNYQRWIQEGGE